MSTHDYAGFDRTARDTIRALEALGWTFQVTGKRSAARGKAPDGVTVGSIPRRIEGDPHATKNARSILARWMKKIGAEQAAEEGRMLVERALDATLDGDDVIADVLAAAAEKRVRQVMDSRPPTVISEPSPVGDTVDRRPWLARVGSNRGKAEADLYESEAVIQATYPDGTVMYECSLDDCDYENANPRGVAAHYAGHVRAGEAPAVGDAERKVVAKDVAIDVSTMRDGYGGHGYSPTDRLVRALAHFLLEHGDMGGVEETARAALLWFHDRPDLGDAEERTREPLTDAEILAKVRLLVGGRDVPLEEKYAALQATTATLTAQVQSLTDALTEERAKSASIQADLDTWLSLAPRASQG